MKKITIICEGYSELAFCKDILEPHLKNFGIELFYELTDHSKDGGITKWHNIKNQIIKIFTIDQEMTISTFFDYYGMNKSLQFRRWTEAEQEMDRSIRMEILEKGMDEDIDDEIKFIPYVQLHEYEALVFTDYAAFELLYDDEDANLVELKRICEQYPNPEEINNIKITSPSHRLLQNIRRYNKIQSGIDLITATGLAKIRDKCPRFNEWVKRLESI
jgi:hypothetical protein